MPQVDTRLLALAMLFGVALATANLLSAKIITIGGVFVPAGILAYACSYPLTDVICELWGPRPARRVVLIGFLALLLVWLLTTLALHWPAAPFWDGQAAYQQTLGPTARIILASIVAYLISQSIDVWLFARLKTHFRGRHLWLRNNLSTLCAQSIDSVLFISIAFGGVLPLAPLIFGQLLVKFGIALLDTPLVYLLVRLINPSPPATQSERERMNHR